MEWTQSMRMALDYIERNLLEDITPADVARAVHISDFYFQRGFSLLSGCTIGEYIRNRRLYLAALDLLDTQEKVIDLALKYGYETPESFTKAFRRFHGASPAQVRQSRGTVRPFLPLRITITVKGGNEMDYTIEKMDAFKIVGMSRRFGYDNSYAELPKFWEEFFQNFAQRAVRELGGNETIGKYGICIDDAAEDFEYWIAGDDLGAPVPEWLSVREIPAQTWAKFTCTSAMPGAIQSVNTKIFKSGFPATPDWELAGGFNIEMYDMDDNSSPDYHSEVWIPVKRREA